jgi:CelD/BcsL family acetyltransferase involved in cellulose biosynthesis
LERKLFAREFRDGVLLLREILTEADQQFANLSFGLFHGKRLVGYLIAYVELESVFGEASGKPGEEVVYLRGLAILPRYRSQLLHFMRRLSELISAYCPGAPVEAESVPDKADAWAGLHGLIRRYGYALCHEGPTQEQAPGIMLQGLRWEVSESSRWLPDKSLPLPQRIMSSEHSGRRLAVTVVNHPRQWLSLRGVWDELLRATPGYTLFQSFDYLWTWWRHFGTFSDLRILVITEGDEVIGVAPLALDIKRSMGLMVRSMGFIGAPWQVDRAQFLFGNEFDACIGAVFDWLAANKDSWDVCGFYEQIAETPAAKAITGGFRGLGCVVSESDQHPCPYIEIRGEFDAYLATRSRKLRQNLRRSKRQLEDHGEVGVEIVSQWPSLDQAIDRFVSLERRSWKRAGNLGVGRNQADDGFYRRLAQSYGAAGDFQMRFLKVGERDVAATFGICFDAVFYSLMIVHDQSFDRCSPGTLLEALELEECFLQGLREYDMLGGYVNNKLRWTSSVRSTVHQHFVQRKPRAMAWYLLQFVLLPGIRRLLERAGLLPWFMRWKKRLGDFYRKRFKSESVQEAAVLAPRAAEDRATSAGC